MLVIAEPKADYDGNPQLEDGFTRIANELLEAMVAYPLNGAEYKVVLALIRRTYGFNKKADAISYSQLASLTGLHRITVCKTLATLEKAGVVVRLGGGGRRTIIWGVNKHYREWVAPTVSQTANSDEPTVSDDTNRSVSDDTNSLTESVSQMANHKRQGLKDSKDKRERKRSAPAIPAGVIAYHEERGRYPRRETYALIAETVPDDPISLETFKRAIRLWAATPYKQDNVNGILDWFRELQEGRDPRSRRNNGSRASPAPVRIDSNGVADLPDGFNVRQ